MKILQVSKKFPIPSLDGETIAIIEMGKALIDEGCEVSLLTMNTTRHYKNFTLDQIKKLHHYKEIATVVVDNDIKIINAFTNLFSDQSYHISRFISTEFETKLIELLKANQYDIVQLETLYLAPYVDAIKKHSEALVVMRAHNIEHEIWDRISNQIRFLPKKWYLSYLSKKLKNFEVNKLNDYDFLVAITDRDLKKFKSLGYKNGCISTPVGFDYNQYKPDYSSYDQPLKLSFIGSLDWIPNIEGLNWFFEEIWPQMHQKFPTLEFHFTGRNAPSTLRNINIDNVFYHEDQACAQKFINQFSVLIVPLLAGSGIRIKILEAMALGKVVITTSIGLEGIPATHRENILIADNASEFIEAIQFCQIHQKDLKAFGERAQKFISTYFNRKKLTQNLIKAYQTAITDYHIH